MNARLAVILTIAALAAAIALTALGAPGEDVNLGGPIVLTQSAAPSPAPGRADRIRVPQPVDRGGRERPPAAAGDGDHAAEDGGGAEVDAAAGDVDDGGDDVSDDDADDGAGD